VVKSKKNIPPYFSNIEKYIDRFNNLTKELSLTRLALALGYVMKINEIVGVNTLSHMYEIIKVDKLKISPDKYENISADNPMYINPLLWKL
jgi:aryl-alcohol dehydrogenase-like predicted oxidoreductase